MYKTPTLYGYSSNGDIKTWNAYVIGNEHENYTQIQYEFGLEHGKKQVQPKQIDEGKNIGRSNETTHYEQAVKEVKSKMKKKMDSGYCEDRNNIQTPILPMLAHTFEKRKHNIKYPCFIQPKIDGIRMTCRMVNGRIEMFTRKGKPFTPLHNLEKHLEDCFKNIDEQPDTFYLDGELFSDTLTFQELAGVVRSSKSSFEELSQVKYVIFDCFDTDYPNMGFDTRFPIVGQMKPTKELKPNTHNDYIVTIPTTLINGEDEIQEINKGFMENGYEGTIIRNKNGIYKLNHRSPDLQKYKTFLDDEYEIVSYRQGTGTDEGCVIWECVTKDKQIFSVRPRGSVSERQGYFQNGDKWIGSLLTIRYQELTDGGIPRFPVGITIRNYE